MAKTFQRVKRTSPKRDQNANYARPLRNANDVGAPDSPILSARQSIILTGIAGGLYFAVIGIVAKVTGPTVAIVLLLILALVIVIVGILYSFNGFQLPTKSARSTRRKRSVQQHLSKQHASNPTALPLPSPATLSLDDSVLPIVEAPPIPLEQPKAASAPANLGAEVSNLSSESAKLHYKTGLTLLKEDKLDEAIAAFRQSVQFDPTSVQAYEKLGRACFQNEEFNEAIAAFRAVVDLDPQSFRAYEGLGRALIKAKQIDEGIACLEKSLEINADHQPARSLLMRVSSQRKR